MPSQRDWIPDSSTSGFDGRLIGVTVESWGEYEREIVEHPGAVAVVAVDRDGYLNFVRQLREPARRHLIELPAGTREPGEDPIETAKRELQEETGLHGGVWQTGPVFFSTPGFCRERVHLFFVDELDRGEVRTVGDEVIEVVRWPIDVVSQRLGELEDAKTLVGVLLWLRNQTRLPTA